MSREPQNLKKPFSGRTLNWLLAAAIVILLIPFACDAYLAYRDRNRDDSVQTHADQVTVLDGANMLTPEEAEKLKADMLPLTAYFPAALGP